LFYSVNASGQFCGMAQMTSGLDYEKKFGEWSQDKWKGQFSVRWIFIKDVPNKKLRHITLPNNDNKAVTNSRDTQEVLKDQSKELLQIFAAFQSRTSLQDDFNYYDHKQANDGQGIKVHRHRRRNHNRRKTTKRRNTKPKKESKETSSSTAAKEATPDAAVASEPAAGGTTDAAADVPASSTTTAASAAIDTLLDGIAADKGGDTKAEAASASPVNDEKVDKKVDEAATSSSDAAAPAPST
jgi:hypothetical protein